MFLVMFGHLTGRNSIRGIGIGDVSFSQEKQEEANRTIIQ